MTANALSFDVEDWFHCTHLEKYINPAEWQKCKSIVEPNTRKILSLLHTKKTFATFFVLGWVAERHPELIWEISRQGHEIATHGWSHVRAYHQSPAEFTQELKRSIEVLKGITGKEVLGHRAACFSITSRSRWVPDILLENGIRYDSSIYPVVHDNYGIVNSPRFPYILLKKEGKILLEFPPATYKLMKLNIPIAGGGYFRLYPYGLTRWFIRSLNKNGHPAMVYLHPPEFDPAQPRLRLPLKTGFRVYTGLENNFYKLNRLLNDFSFAPVKDVLSSLGLISHMR